MAQLTDNAEKMAIVDRLVRDGAIDFAEALKLLEVEVKTVTLPAMKERETNPYRPFQPFAPVYGPNRTDGAPFLSPITCSGGTTTVTLTPEMLANSSFTAKN